MRAPLSWSDFNVERVKLPVVEAPAAAVLVDEALAGQIGFRDARGQRPAAHVDVRKEPVTAVERRGRAGQADVHRDQGKTGRSLPS